ncbi:MAG TPA: hypothetical protein VII24_03165, partial [Pseudolabrys sp.]
LRTTTNSSRVAMLTRLIPTPTAEHRRGTNQVRQQVTIREHFRRRNATNASTTPFMLSVRSCCFCLQPFTPSFKRPGPAWTGSVSAAKP